MTQVAAPRPIVQAGPATEVTPLNQIGVRLVAILAVLAVGAYTRLPYELKPATVACLALAPFWLFTVKRYAWAGVLILAGLVTLLSGIVITWLMLTYGHHQIVVRDAFTTGQRLITLLGSIGLLAWARTVLQVRWVAVLWGVAAVITLLPKVPASSNPWKYLLSIPVTMIVFGLASNSRSMLPTWVGVSVLVILDGLNSSRSHAAFIVLAVLMVFISRVRGQGRRLSRSSMALVLAVSTGAVYVIGTSVMSEGMLGPQIQQRTQMQLEQGGGNLLLGGRPEWLGSLALIKDSPFGNGMGSQPTSNDVALVKTAMQPLNIPTYKGYVDKYMLHKGFNLHSVTAQMWNEFGPTGLLFAFLLIGLCVQCMLTWIAFGRLEPVTAAMCLLAVWFLLFGTYNGDLPVIAAGLGLGLYEKSMSRRPQPVPNALPSEP